MFFLVIIRAPRSTLFPYTTLFRSQREAARLRRAIRLRERRQRGFDFARPGWTPAIAQAAPPPRRGERDRKSTRLNSSHMSISYAVFCLKKKTRRFPNVIT